MFLSNFPKSTQWMINTVSGPFISWKRSELDHARVFHHPSLLVVHLNASGDQVEHHTWGKWLLDVEKPGAKIKSLQMPGIYIIRIIRGMTSFFTFSCKIRLWNQWFGPEGYPPIFDHTGHANVSFMKIPYGGWDTMKIHRRTPCASPYFMTIIVGHHPKYTAIIPK